MPVHQDLHPIRSECAGYENQHRCFLKPPGCCWGFQVVLFVWVVRHQSKPLPKDSDSVGLCCKALESACLTSAPGHSYNGV